MKIKIKNLNKIIESNSILLPDILHNLNISNIDDVICYESNGIFFDLNQPIKYNEINLIYINSDVGKNILNHSTAHLLAHAIHNLYPNALFCIGPTINNGFYYDIDFLNLKLSEKDFEKIENEMYKIAKSNFEIKREIVTYKKALELFKNNKYKIDIINNIKGEISIYKQDNFFDLCRGPHVPNTSYLKNFKILSLAGAYWHGDVKNKQLTRIYGTSSINKEELKKYLNLLEERKKNDHKKLGKELDLIMLSKYSHGSVFWLPKGIILIEELKKFYIKKHIKNNYLFVKTPILLSKELWINSGHWDNYKNNIYTTKIEDQEYAIKPMNCPGSILIYKNNLHSYKELPIKIGEFGLVHRKEATGALNGLFRLRSFTQDDAHIFCKKEQLKNEITKIIKLFDEFYNLLKIDYSIELSTRPKNYIGDIDIWNESEKILKEICKKNKKFVSINEGDGAFYGPKLDFKIKDSMERVWQCGTIQLDMNLPNRFDLNYIDKNNKKIRPIIIHRTLFGSLERFIGILIEHYKGIFPLWLAPEQVRILTINNKYHLIFAKKIAENFKKKDIRVKIDDSNEKLSYKIRNSQIQKIPYTIIIGDNEVKNKTLSYRIYGDHKQTNTTEKKITKMILKIISKKLVGYMLK